MMTTSRGLVLCAAALVVPACVVVDLDFLYPATTAATSTGGGGAGGTATSGGNGGGPVCAPGATRACYSGPEGTAGQGICRAGSQTCAADGAGWGACEGEVQPLPEDCATADDEDCDGKAPPCTGTLAWVRRFGDDQAQAAQCVAVDGNGDLHIGGSFAGSVDFGGGSALAAPPGVTQGFVAKVDGAGGYQAAKVYGAGNTACATFEGDTILAGRDVSFSPPYWDGFLLDRLHAGSLVWGNSFAHAPANGTATGIAVDAAGNVVGVGFFEGTVDFGGGPVTSHGTDAFVLRLDANGNYLWALTFGDAAEQSANAVAVDSLGTVLVAGRASGTLDLGCGPMAASGRDAFVAKLGSDGSCSWSKVYGDGADQEVTGIAAAPNGDVLVTGTYAGAIDLGGGPLPTSGGAPFVARFSGAGGHLWSKALAGQGTAAAVAAGTGGHVLVTGTFQGAADLGGGVVQAQLGGSMFLARLDATGAFVWGHAVGPRTSPAAIAVDAEGNVIVAGQFEGMVDFGLGPLVSTVHSPDAFVAKFGP